MSTLRNALRRAWDDATSADPALWSFANPAYGQCAVTALVVQDALGGLLVRGAYPGGSHYWNMIGDSRTDLTIEQFKPAAPAFTDVRYVDRDYMLSNHGTHERYHRLSKRVLQALLTP